MLSFLISFEFLNFHAGSFIKLKYICVKISQFLIPFVYVLLWNEFFTVFLTKLKKLNKFLAENIF